MAWKKEPCPKCGEPKTVVSKVCWNCLHKNPLSVTCPQCAGPKAKYAARCRACQIEEAANWKPCPGCKTPIRKVNQQCRSCYDQQREATKPLCVDCGKPTKRYAYEYHAQRCWPCDVVRRRSQPKRPCSVSGCQRPHAAKGFCRNHYSAQYQPRPRGALRGGRAKLLLAAWPCQICGYHQMNSDIHRIIPGAEGGRYTVGNMVALCVRCHREVHRGLSPTPIPPSEEEIRSFQPSV